MDALTHQLADLLLAIEAEMRRIGFWEDSPPPAEALASLMPFCYDTLEFQQWLQWVFLPRMKEVAESDEGWPTTSDIFSMGEHAFAEFETDTGMLLLQLRQFDNLVNRRSL